MPNPVERAMDFNSTRKKSSRSAILRNNFLFVIGINDYQHCTKLNNAVKDAQDMEAILQDKYRFKDDYIYRLYDADATIDKMEATFKELKDRVNPSTDNLVIFFSGHGYYDEDWGQAYWVPVEARADRALGEYFSHDDLIKRVKYIDTHHTVIIADSCYSGSAFVSKKRSLSADPAIFEKEPSRWMLASGRNEPVPDGGKGGNSPFTKELLTILGKEAKEGIRMGTLVEKIKVSVTHNSSQTPIGAPLNNVGDRGGEFVFYPKDQEEDVWREVQAVDKIDRYEKFCNDFKGGVYEDKARLRLLELKAELAYAIIEDRPSIALCQEYQDNFPNGWHLKEVSEIKYRLIENDFWDEVQGKNTLEAYNEYLAKYPDGIYVDEAKEGRGQQEQGARAWKEAEAFNSIEAFQSFIKKYPESEYFDAATYKVKELTAWKHAKASKNAEKLEAFIKGFPESPHLGKAKELLAGTEESKLKKKKRWLYIGIAALIALIVGISIGAKMLLTMIDVESDKKNVRTALVEGDLAKAGSALTNLVENAPNDSDVENIYELFGIADTFVTSLKSGRDSLAAKFYVIAKGHFTTAKNMLGKGYDKLNEKNDIGLDSLFDEYFDKTQVKSIDSSLTLIKNTLDHNKVAARVKILSDQGDDFFYEGKYIEAFAKYDSASKKDLYNKASYLTEKRALAPYIEFLPKVVMVKGGKSSLKPNAKTSPTSIPEFTIGTYEVSNSEYVAFLKAHKGSDKIKDWIKLSYSDIKESGDTFKISRLYKDHPVVGVSWYGAKAYADWSMSDLPTELEWEFAASAGGKEAYEYSGSNSANDVAQYHKRSNLTRARKVGDKKPNGLGIYDMSGNVWEWCKNGSRNDVGIIKGGSINRGEAFSKIENRFEQSKDKFTSRGNGKTFKNDMGFRIIRRK